MFLSHYATFLITSCSHDFEDYVRSILYMVLRYNHSAFLQGGPFEMQPVLRYIEKTYNE